MSESPDRPDPPARTPPPSPHGEPTRHLPATAVLPRFAEDEAPPPPPSTSGRGGCLATLLPVLVLVLPLVALALLLPPFSLGNVLDSELNAAREPSGEETGPPGVWVTLDATSPQAEQDGLTLSVSPEAIAGPLHVQVTALAAADFLAGDVPDTDWYCGPDVPPDHALASAVYSLARQGAVPTRLTLTLAVTAPEAGSGELQARAWNEASRSWERLAVAEAEATAVTVEVPYLPRCVTLMRRVATPQQVALAVDAADRFDPTLAGEGAVILLGSIQPTRTGALDVVLAPGVEAGEGYELVPLIQNFSDPAVVDTATVRALLENPALRTEHARQIAAFVVAGPAYRGAALDYRDIPPELRHDFSRFVRDLATLLRGQGRTLTVIVPFPTPAAGGENWDTGAYDWAELGRVVDTLVIQGPLDPAAYAPDGAVDQVLVWAQAQVDRGTLALGLDTLSLEDAGDGSLLPVTFRQALAYLGEVVLDAPGAVTPGQTIRVRLAHPAGIQAEFIAGEGLPVRGVRYYDAGGNWLRTMWVTDGQALAYRMARAVDHGLGGVMVRNLFAEGVVPDVAQVLPAYRAESLADVPPLDLSPEWVVLAGDTIVGQGTGPWGQPFTFEVWDETGLLTVEVRLAGVVIGSRSLDVVAPLPTATSTPTPSPTTTPGATATPTIPPTETGIEIVPLPGASPVVEATPTVPTPVPLSATPMPSPSPTTPPPTPSEPTATATLPALSAIPTVDPTLLTDAMSDDGFAAGAHLGALNRSLLQAGRAHLGWIALDVTYRIGSTPGAQQMNIEQGHGNGFKVLLTVSGDPDEFASMDRAEYVEFFTTYLAGLAAYQPDAIEVWREANTVMPPDVYAALLALSYRAIKTANPSTWVISGALAPVEDPDAPGGDDAAYFTQLAAQGAASFMDCIGVQYTLGAVPPASVGGDPRGSHPIYYLPTMTDRARNPFGGTLPLCFTRFGYLSPEGIAALPEDLAWAQNTTVAQQAQWVADAVQLSMEGTQVRLLILWSLDSSAFEDGSPLAGYALIRPDGSCPACDALAPLLETPTG